MKSDKPKLMNPHREFFEASKFLISALSHAYGVPKEAIEACLIKSQFEEGDKEKFDKYVANGGTRCIACFKVGVPTLEICPVCGKSLIPEIMIAVSPSYKTANERRRGRLKPIRKRGSKK